MIESVVRTLFNKKMSSMKNAPVLTGVLLIFFTFWLRRRSRNESICVQNVTVTVNDQGGIIYIWDGFMAKYK